MHNPQSLPTRHSDRTSHPYLHISHQGKGQLQTAYSAKVKHQCFVSPHHLIQEIPVLALLHIHIGGSVSYLNLIGDKANCLEIPEGRAVGNIVQDLGGAPHSCVCQKVRQQAFQTLTCQGASLVQQVCPVPIP